MARESLGFELNSDVSMTKSVILGKTDRKGVVKQWHRWGLKWWMSRLKDALEVGRSGRERNLILNYSIPPAFAGRCLSRLHRAIQNKED